MLYLQDVWNMTKAFKEWIQWSVECECEGLFVLNAWWSEKKTLCMSQLAPADCRTINQMTVLLNVNILLVRQQHHKLCPIYRS